MDEWRIGCVKGKRGNSLQTAVGNEAKLLTH